MADENPARAEAIRTLKAHVTERLRRRDDPESIRSDLLASGVDAATAAYLLTECAPQARGRFRSAFAMGLSGVMVIACGLAGLIGGLWVASLLPPAPGLAAAVSCLAMGGVVLLGLALGVGVGLGATMLLARWSERTQAADNFEEPMV